MYACVCTRLGMQSEMNSSKLLQLKDLEKRKKKLTVELREDTRAMIAALRSSHTQMHRYCEATSLSLEKSIVSYLHSSNQHVLQDAGPSSKRKTSNDYKKKTSNDYDTQRRTVDNGVQFRTSTSALRHMHESNCTTNVRVRFPAHFDNIIMMMNSYMLVCVHVY